MWLPKNDHVCSRMHFTVFCHEIGVTCAQHRPQPLEMRTNTHCRRNYKTKLYTKRNKKKEKISGTSQQPKNESSVSCSFTSTCTFSVIDMKHRLGYTFVEIETWAVYIYGSVEFVGTVSCNTRWYSRTTCYSERVRIQKKKVYCIRSSTLQKPIYAKPLNHQASRQQIPPHSVQLWSVANCKLIKRCHLGGRSTRRTTPGVG